MRAYHQPEFKRAFHCGYYGEFGQQETSWSLRTGHHQRKVWWRSWLVRLDKWLLAQATGGEKISGFLNDYDRPTFPPEVILCNTDGAWLISKHAGLGWCFQNSAQNLYLEGSRSLNHVSSPLMVEALAMRAAIEEAKHISLTKVWFRTDSQELSRAINWKSYPVKLFGVLMDIELLSSSFAFFYVSFIGHALNGTADSLAKSALHSFVSPLYWTSSFF